jgi:hypothetical protein
MINRKCGNGRIVSRERPVCPRFVHGIYLVQGQATVNGKGNCVPADAAGVILSPPTALQDLKQNFQQ